jgi:hypothetical protein
VGRVTSDVRARLVLAARARFRAEEDRRAAMLETARWLVAGHAEGIPVAELARLAGVTRQTVYDVLGRAARSVTNP